MAALAPISHLEKLCKLQSALTECWAVVSSWEGCFLDHCGKINTIPSFPHAPLTSKPQLKYTNFNLFPAEVKMSFHNWNFNDNNNVVIKMIRRCEEKLCICFWEKKAKSRGSIKMKTFQKVQIFNVVALMPCWLGTRAHTLMFPFSHPRWICAPKCIFLDPTPSPHVREENVNAITRTDSRKALWQHSQINVWLFCICFGA